MSESDNTTDNLTFSRKLSELADAVREQAIREALENGRQYPEIARELGVSRQAVRQYVERRKR